MDTDKRTPDEIIDDAVAEREAAEERASLSVMGRVTSDALERIAADVGEAGGRLIAGFVAVVAEGVSPNGGQWFVSDVEDGPQDPHDQLAFILSAAKHFAQRNGLPFVLGEIPEGAGGQG